MLLRRLALSFLCTAALSFAGCGSESVQALGAGKVHEPGHGKPNAAVGALEIAIVERPSSDRARVRATWRSADGVAGCELQLRLPDGAVMIEGERSYALGPDEREGVREWLVEFPTGMVLDATVRLCGDAGAGLRLCESYVRLTP